MKCHLRAQEETLVPHREDSHSKRSEPGDAVMEGGRLCQPAAVSMEACTQTKGEMRDSGSGT